MKQYERHKIFHSKPSILNGISSRQSNFSLFKWLSCPFLLPWFEKGAFYVRNGYKRSGKREAWWRGIFRKNIALILGFSPAQGGDRMRTDLWIRIHENPRISNRILTLFPTSVIIISLKQGNSFPKATQSHPSFFFFFSPNQNFLLILKPLSFSPLFLPTRNFAQGWKIPPSPASSLLVEFYIAV